MTQFALSESQIAELAELRNPNAKADGEAITRTRAKYGWLTEPELLTMRVDPSGKTKKIGLHLICRTPGCSKLHFRFTSDLWQCLGACPACRAAGKSSRKARDLGI